MGLDMYLKRRVAELEEKNADLEARLGHEQVVTMQNREAQLQGYIRDLGARVAALQEIAAEERAKYNLSWKDCAYRATDTYCEKTHNYCTSEDCPLLEEQKTEARRQLAEEHPEAFR